MRHLTLAAMACLSLAACKQDAAAPPDVLGTGTEWTVTEIAGTPVPEGVTVTMQRPEPGMLAGTSGCNRYGGPIRAEKGRIHIGALVGTRMMCPDPQMTVETAFHSTIGRVTGARKSGTVLELTDDAGTVLIRARH
ncbi:META domain-containing protein [Paenirhodobacter sp.]|uniref:META domain-containing protein n=1 Tax=Paenirhodobacter sp. TaxID=1965326 RepID=UPI003B40EB55